jgi:hypothetical protein|tara:strand:- start:1045 stop:2202 length:1158 start_codon:yes stop_codon:yes gene_type:complete
MAELNKEFFCPAPFAGGYVDVKKIAYPCCKIRVTEFENDPGCDLTKNNLSTAYHSKSFKDLREQFENNEKPDQCQECWRAEDAGCESERNHLTKLITTDTNSLNSANVGLKKLQIVPSITCNFKCRICDSNFSSAIAMEEIKFAEAANKEKLLLNLQNRSLIDIEYTKRILQDSLSGLTMLQVLGGEPTLMKNLPELLEYIIAQGDHKHIDLAINTNGSIWSDRLTEILQKFKSCKMLISIDAFGKRFEDQRGGCWQDIEDNFDRWLTVPNVSVIITATVSIQNVLYVDEIVDFVKSKGVFVGWNYVDDPSELSIDNLTQTAKDLVYLKYINHESNELHGIATRVMQTPAVSGQKFISLMDLYDLRRGTNFKQSHGEIYDAMSAK